MKSDLAELIAFVLEKAEQAPLHRRARIFRGLASVCGDQDEQKQLNQIAKDLNNADALCREFNFKFIQKNRL